MLNFIFNVGDSEFTLFSTMVWGLCNSADKVVSVYFVFQVDVVADNSISGKCTLLLSGYIRARSLSVNQLVIVLLHHIALRY